MDNIDNITKEELATFIEREIDFEKLSCSISCHPSKNTVRNWISNVVSIGSVQCFFLYSLKSQLHQNLNVANMALWVILKRCRTFLGCV